MSDLHARFILAPEPLQHASLPQGWALSLCSLPLPSYHGPSVLPKRRQSVNRQSDLLLGNRWPQARATPAPRLTTFGEGHDVTLSDFLDLLTGEKLALAAAGGLVLLFTGVSLLTPSTTADFLDACKNKTDLKGPVLRFVGVRVAQAVLSLLQRISLATLAERIRTKLRVRFFAAALNQEIAFFDANSRGELMDGLGEDIAVMQRGMTDNLASALNCLGDVIGAGYRLFAISTKGTLLVLSALPVVSLGLVLSQGLSRALSMDAFNAQKETQRLAHDILSNPRVVQSFCGEEREVERYGNKMHETYVKQKQAVVVSGVLQTGFQILTASMLGGGFYYGGKLVHQEVCSVTDILQFTQYAMRVGNALVHLMNIGDDGVKAMTAGQRVFNVCERRPRIFSGTSKTLQGSTGAVEFSDVGFVYPTRPDHPVLESLNLSLKPGTVTALVGGSGNGKSTIGHLLQRFYDPVSGQVTLDGCDIRDLDLKWLRRQIATVSQEPVLLAGTIRENIIYGAPDASEEEIQRAAAQASAMDFIENLPEGFNTPVTTLNLSAGQRQRIAIARAILKNPKILLLDEATSQLDSESESVVQHALDQLMKGRTTLVIAHRLSTVRHADNICVLENGNVIEQGKHETLVKRGGVYAALVAKQGKDRSHNFK